MTHTPGPWEVGDEDDKNESGSVYCDNSLGSRVAIVFGEDQKYSVFSRDEERANARLIAAAPDLLAALKWVRSNYASGPTAEINRVIDEAIAKAES